MNSHPLQRAPKRKTNIPQPIELEEYPPQMDQDIARLQSLIQKNKLKIKKLQKEKQDFIIEAETSESQIEDESDEAQNTISKETSDLEARKKALKIRIREANGWSPEGIQFQTDMENYTSQLTQVQTQEALFSKEIEDLTTIVLAMGNNQEFASDKLETTKMPKYPPGSTASQLQLQLFELRKQIIKKYSTQVSGDCTII